MINNKCEQILDLRKSEKKKYCKYTTDTNIIIARYLYTY